MRQSQSNRLLTFPPFKTLCSKSLRINSCREQSKDVCKAVIFRARGTKDENRRVDSSCPFQPKMGGGPRLIYGSANVIASKPNQKIQNIQYNFKHQLMEIKPQNSLFGAVSSADNEDLKSCGSWTFDENLLYVLFLQKNKVVMQSKRKRKNQRIFDKMSDFVTTRSSLQCRSHHQKFLEKLGDIKAIILNFKKFITKDDLRTKTLELQGKKPASQGLNDKIKAEEISCSGQEADPEESVEGQAPMAQQQQQERQQKPNSSSSTTSNSQHQNEQEEQKKQGFTLTRPQFYQTPFVVLDQPQPMLNYNYSLLQLYLQNMMDNS